MHQKVYFFVRLVLLFSALFCFLDIKSLMATPPWPKNKPLPVFYNLIPLETPLWLSQEDVDTTINIAVYNPAVDDAYLSEGGLPYATTSFKVKGLNQMLIGGATWKKGDHISMKFSSQHQKGLYDVWKDENGKLLRAFYVWHIYEATNLEVNESVEVEIVVGLIYVPY